MKHIIIALASLLLVMGLIGCDSSSGIETMVIDQPYTLSTETMVIDKPYTLNIGDEIQKITPSANIEIVQNSGEDQAQYTLMVGKAEIIRQ